MKIKLNSTIYLNMLLKAETALKQRHFLEKQAEIDKFNKSWLVKFKLCKKATMENHLEVINIWRNKSFWMQGKINLIEDEVETILFAMRSSSKEFMELQSIEVDADVLSYLNKIISKQPKR